ncbi:hemolysin-III protein [Aspergillus violaceofuscus CBS 115571]|uniref:Hemolysin-III protein n=1 Tax=Aspergillus violaceofuscus (strain CBS 115571) TaxID=1450538 RepID=A0A2V5H5P6_ASPV1|nr:hemolysin-III protein [Aspergillus violaceofuscus CBS 115571]
MSGAELKRRQVPKVNMDTGIDYTNQPKVKARTLDNQYILGGYRIFTSLTFLHNESCNVYSHLTGALLLPLVATTFGRKLAQPQFLGVSFMDYATFGIYFWCAEIGLVLSALYHPMQPHSRRVEQFWHGTDLLGIVIVTVGTFSSGIYHVCLCEANLQKLHWAIVLVTGFVTGVLISNPLLRTPRRRKVKVDAFVIFGTSSFIPWLHGVQRYGLGYMLQYSGMRWYLLELSLYGIGVSLDASVRYLGKLAPDLPLAILGAMYTHQIALLQGFTACHTLDVCQLQGVY